MGSILLSAVWVGSFVATKEETEKFRADILLEAKEEKLKELITSVCSSSNGLTQFMIMPCASKEGWPDKVSWEKLVSYTAMKSAGTSFSIKRAYLAAN